jgi:excisionase family DNA binding protein
MTTGEAAALLGSSRQHVVDLCERGELPYSTTGRHRRVRRRDVEEVQARTEDLTRDQARSLWLSYALAGRIAEDPEAAVAKARANLAKMREVARGQAQSWLGEWESLIEGGADHMLDALTSRSPRGRELRQNNPFAGVLTDEERVQVLAAWRHTQTARA